QCARALPGNDPEATRHVFLVERYRGSSHAHEIGSFAARLEAATGVATRVRYLGSIYVTADETCFCLFEADGIDDVREVNARASLAFDRISEAVVLSPELRVDPV